AVGTESARTYSTPLMVMVSVMGFVNGGVDDLRAHMCALRVKGADPREQHALGDWCGVPGAVLPQVAVNALAAGDVVEHFSSHPPFASPGRQQIRLYPC
ncbi:MAG: hypothetical protein ACO24H_09025, partial [Polynucleobacter sp.]